MSQFVVEIYLPYLSCACSPGAQDKKTQNLQETLLKLKEKYDITYQVYALNQHLQIFKSKPELVSILQNQGKKGLPAIFINSNLQFQGKHPEYTELENVLQDIGTKVE